MRFVKKKLIARTAENISSLSSTKTLGKAKSFPLSIDDFMAPTTYAMQPSCLPQLTIHGLNYHQNEEKKSFSVAMHGSYSSFKLPIQEQRLPAIVAPKRVRVPEPKRNAKGEQRAIRSSSSRQEEEEP